MGKCVRIRGSSKPPSPPGTASCLTLRSGRRVPPVAASSPACSARTTTTSGRPRRRHRGSSANRWCGGGGAGAITKKSACGGSPQRSGAAHASESPEEVPSRAAAADSCAAAVVAARGDVDHGRGDSFDIRRPPTPLLTDDCYAAAGKAKAKHENNESHRCCVVDVAGQTPSSPSPPRPPMEAEIEAFFAAAELAERRRFVEAYNYDVALDRPLEGRFEWAPVST